YAILTEDAEQLAAIEYTPGNHLVKHFLEADWKVVGSSVLGWPGFLYAHDKICRAIYDGSWGENAVATRT
ncbi:hypothetical protein PAXRUDRAFT_153674, partial [Paxillus rubicundulus Ve08.2h10]